MRGIPDPKSLEALRRNLPAEPDAAGKDEEGAPIYAPRIPSKEEMLKARERL